MLDVFEVLHWLVIKGTLFDRKIPEKLISPTTSSARKGVATPMPMEAAVILLDTIRSLMVEFEETIS